jgi:steroid 5-alpha reductase family enzyme
MWRIALILIFTLVAVPILTFQYDEPLSDLQWQCMQVLLITYGSAAFLAFVVSTITKNYSQVDKLWSTIPIAYGWIMAHHADYDPRVTLMAGLITLWGLRLTYNFNRRGGYSWKFWTGEEDYRWSILRAKPGFEQEWKWVLFNLLFISGYQMGLIMMMTLPALKVMGSDVPLGIWDYVVAAVFVGFVIIEYIADQQQYDYQEAKYAKKNAGEKLEGKYALGFVHNGLWGYMRHPNYMAEQAVWIVFYLFSIVATGTYINWSIAGCLLIVVLFFGSSYFSESISAEKYPEYKRYIKEVGRFLPIKGKFKV